jgi:hypothetical protein
VGIQLYNAEVGPTSGPTRRFSHLRVDHHPQDRVVVARGKVLRQHAAPPDEVITPGQSGGPKVGKFHQTPGKLSEKGVGTLRCNREAEGARQLRWHPCAPLPNRHALPVLGLAHEQWVARAGARVRGEGGLPLGGRVIQTPLMVVLRSK